MQTRDDTFPKTGEIMFLGKSAEIWQLEKKNEIEGMYAIEKYLKIP